MNLVLFVYAPEDVHLDRACKALYRDAHGNVAHVRDAGRLRARYTVRVRLKPSDVENAFLSFEYASKSRDEDMVQYMFFVLRAEFESCL